MATDPNSAEAESAATGESTDGGAAQAADRGRAVTAMMAVQQGGTPPELDDDTAAAVGQYVTQSTTDDGPPSTKTYPPGGTRRHLMGPGMSHGGERDIWGTLGYPEVDTVDAEQYLERYERQDLARAIISIPVETTWKEYPTITDGGDEEDEGGEEADSQSAFESAIETLETGRHLQQSLLHYFEWADRLQRIGEYGILFLGLDDGRSIDQPVNTEALEGPEDLTYIQPFSQASITDWELAPPDSAEREPGMPLSYTIEFERPAADDASTEVEERAVHYSRVTHLVEQPEQSILKHTPVLEPILNRLIDHEKVVGAAAEMFWSSADRKFFAQAQGGGFNEEDIERFDRQMWEMVNGMRTTAAGENIDLEVIDGQSVDPSGIIEAIIKSIVSVVGIPMRKLLGSERGELASSMDQETWYGKIEERQRQFAEPVIVRSTLMRLIEFGVLPAPEGGDFDVEWPDLYKLSDEDKSQIHKTEAQAVQAAENAIALGAPRRAMYEDILDMDPEALEEVPDGPAPPGEGDEEFPDDVTGGPADEPGGEPGGPEEGTQPPTAPAAGQPTPTSAEHTAAPDGGTVAQEAPPTSDVLAWAPNQAYAEGDVVATPNGRGIVYAVRSDAFAFPLGAGETTEIDASADQPAFVVALERGGSAPYRASALQAVSWDADKATTDGDALANIVNEDVGVDLPAGWDRQTLLQWWSSTGGTRQDARDELAAADGFDGNPEGVASRMMDLVAASRRAGSNTP